MLKIIIIFLQYSMSKEKKIIIIGGAGNVGAPLGVALANEGFKVTLLDLNINNLNILIK